MTRDEVPAVPAGAKKFTGARYIVYDAEIDGHPCRWRYQGSVLVGFTRFAAGVDVKAVDHPTRGKRGPAVEDVWSDGDAARR